jgi:hypothetical protein
MHLLGVMLLAGTDQLVISRALFTGETRNSVARCCRVLVSFDTWGLLENTVCVEVVPFLIVLFQQVGPLLIVQWSPFSVS